jgi:hypothetical protein
MVGTTAPSIRILSASWPKRMGAKAIEVKASHLSLISHPDEITGLADPRSRGTASLMLPAHWLRSPGRVRGPAGEQRLVDRLLHGVEHPGLRFRKVAGKIANESFLGKMSSPSNTIPAVAGGVGYVFARAG